MRLPALGLPAALILLLTALPSAGCGAFKNSPYACGTLREGGGPPVFETRPAQLCETSRVATHVHFEGLEETPPRDAMEHAYEQVARLPRADTVAEFLEQLREALGAELADDVAVAIEWARTQSKKPRDPDPARAEKALVEGAAKGVRIALEERFIYLGGDDGRLGD